MDALTFLTETTNTGASDLFIVAGLPLSYKKNGSLVTMDTDKIMPAQSESMIREIYQLADNRDINRFLETGDDDFSFAVRGLSRYRVSTYKQRGSMPLSSVSSLSSSPIHRIWGFLILSLNSEIQIRALYL